MSLHTMKFPIELAWRPPRPGDPATGCAIQGVDADGNRWSFDDLLVEGDRVAAASERDAEGEATGNDFGPYGVVVAVPAGGLRIVAEGADHERRGA